MTKRVLITGSNNGLGLEFTRQFLEKGWHVYATCRHPLEARELQHLHTIYSELTIYRLDMTVCEDITDLCDNLYNVPVDLLINTAEVSLKTGGAILDSLLCDEWMRTFEVNTIGTARLTHALLNNIALSSNHRLIVSISSRAKRRDSPNSNTSNLGNCFYQSSKAALNLFMREIATELKPLNIGILLVDPGDIICRTGSGTGISACTSVKETIKIINAFSKDQSGKFFRYDGKEVSCPC